VDCGTGVGGAVVVENVGKVGKGLECCEIGP
jgi:hypothetical protein